MDEFKSSGKFLITGEYLILKGAVGLALPLKHGQTLKITATRSNEIKWTSKVFNKTWFEATLDAKSLEAISSTDDSISNSLQHVLKQCRVLNPEFINTGIDAVMEADFNLAWGLGSSSTMIYNIAQWASVDPYILLEKTFGGSGYDIACAGAKGPITFRLSGEERLVNDADFHPAFSKHIFFVYLGKKNELKNRHELF